MTSLLNKKPRSIMVAVFSYFVSIECNGERAALGLKGISGTQSPASPLESRQPFDTQIRVFAALISSFLLL